MHICMYEFMYVFMYVCICMYICMYVYIYVCICMHVCMYVCIRVVCTYLLYLSRFIYKGYISVVKGKYREVATSGFLSH